MQVLILVLVVFSIIAYLIYKIKKTFSKKDFIIFSSFIIVLIIGSIFYSKIVENKLPEAFKAKYLKDKNIKILKLSINQSGVEVLSSNKSIYDFSYIIKKDNIEYVCQAKNIKVQIIEDEYIFDDLKEECKKK